ncbi:putative exporter [Kushneria sinocarnis]|uniref:Putative exporter n=1 Tax=Kushneria sinocarnis TaxID=595502 RepID=A0A420WX80_9GAMM|nr:MMPL family transporter [Kushneria sinocarnis]RKR04344.1 putative exporter [Kushneria sinocarnis]
MSASGRPGERSRWLARLWGLMLLGCVIASTLMLLHGARFDNRVTALLPEDRQRPLVEQASAQLGDQFEDRFALLLQLPGGDTDRLEQTTRSLARQLEQSGMVTALHWQPDDFRQGDPLETLGAQRYRLLTPELRQQLDQGDSAALLRHALSGLVIPAGLDRDPVRDPFGLLDAWLAAQLPSRIHTDHGLITVATEDGRAAMITGQLTGSPYAPELQQQLIAAMQGFEQAHPDATLLRSGLVFHAAAGARQAKHEISTFGVGALIGLVVMLLLVFRSPLTLLTLLLPLVTGTVLALTLTLVFFGGIHLLTLAFGTSLMGVAIDYALHLQCARVSLRERFRLRPLLPGLLLSLLSSALAYGVQAFTPMPGLRQMAFFATCGLIGAWLTVVLWLPQVPVGRSPFTERIIASLWQLLGRLRGRLSWRLALLLAVVALTICAGLTRTNDSLRLLDTSSPAMLDQERRIQQLFGRDTGTLYLLITAADRQQWLEQVEALTPTLETLVDNDHLGGFDSLASAVPSHARQQQNLERVRRLYRTTLPKLYDRAGLPEQLEQRAMQPLAAPPRLEIDDWLGSPLGEGDRRLWLGNVDPKDTRAATGPSPVAGMVVLSGRFDATARARMQQLAADHEGVSFVDRVGRLSAVLGELRQQIAVWVAMALVALVGILTLRYRGRTWRVVTPAAGAILLVLSAYALTGVPLNLFHQLALLLVLGIGLDAGIFSAEHPDDRHVWLAITLSTASSLLTFGLLAFSATPVLHYIGLTALIGLSAVWLLTALVQPAGRHRPSRKPS